MTEYHEDLRRNQFENKKNIFSLYISNWRFIKKFWFLNYSTKIEDYMYYTDNLEGDGKITC